MLWQKFKSSWWFEVLFITIISSLVYLPRLWEFLFLKTIGISSTMVSLAGHMHTLTLLCILAQFGDRYINSFSSYSIFIPYLII